MQCDNRRTLNWPVRLCCRCSLPFRVPEQQMEEKEQGRTYSNIGKKGEKSHQTQQKSDGLRGTPVKETESASSAGSLVR